MAVSTNVCTLSVDPAGGSSYTAVFEVVDIDGPGGPTDDIETTHLASTSKEFIAGLDDGADVNFTINWDPSNATHQSLTTLRGNGNVATWKITYSDSKTTTFSGYVKDWRPNVTTNSKMTSSVAVKVTGDVTWPA